MPKTLLEKKEEEEGLEGWGAKKKKEKKKEPSRGERGSHGKHAAGMTRVRLSLQGMKNSTSQTRRGSGCLLGQRGKGMRRAHKHNYLHASFVVCQNWHAFKDLGVLII